MACSNPATGARTSHYFVKEVDCGVTPTSPAWSPLRYTSGNMQLTKDSIASSELDGSREVADIRLGSNQTAGDISIELSMNFYDVLLEAALGGSFDSGLAETGVDVTVLASAKTFTRAAGSFITDGVEVGDLIKFTDLLNGNNAGSLYVTAVSALVVTCGNAEGLVDETSVTTDYTTGDKLEVGSARTTFSILTHYADADGGAGEYHITKGVEVTGYSFDIAVNAMVTGSLPTIGRVYEPDVALPAGSTFLTPAKTEPYASVDGRILENSVAIGLVTQTTINLDNGASAQFEIGSNDTSFIEQGRANSTLSLQTFFEDSTLLKKFVNETETSVVIILEGSDGSMSFSFPRVIYTTGTPDVAGEGSITQSLDAQALAGLSGESSVVIQRLL